MPVDDYTDSSKKVSLGKSFVTAGAEDLAVQISSPNEITRLHE